MERRSFLGAVIGGAFGGVVIGKQSPVANLSSLIRVPSGTYERIDGSSRYRLLSCWLPEQIKVMLANRCN
jgi:hypothetical protein